VNQLVALGQNETNMTSHASAMPALYLGHGAPPLVDDPVWPGQLASWAASIVRPEAILMISAHWEHAPLTIAATSAVPLVYDFWGFAERYYQLTYPAPGAPRLAARVRELLAPHQPVSDSPERGLDHGAFIPLTCMWPEADVPVLQISMPSLGAKALLETGRQLAPLRDEGVLIIGSGFLTHGLPFIDPTRSDDNPPSWSAEFDAWAAECIAGRDFDALVDFRERAPGLQLAHPTVDHLVPLFVALGATIETSGAIDTAIKGFWLNLSKRSFQFN
jgi:4,5-DOPA dioxygenase extradiol